MLGFFPILSCYPIQMCKYFPFIFNFNDLSVVNLVKLCFRSNDDVFILYKLSYLWLAPIGVTTVISVGLAVSYLTGKEDTEMADPDLFSPVIKGLFPNLGRLRQPVAECVEINATSIKETGADEDAVSS